MHESSYKFRSIHLICAGDRNNSSITFAISRFCEDEDIVYRTTPVRHACGEVDRPARLTVGMTSFQARSSMSLFWGNADIKNVY
jgi:hypothetical protein